MALVMTGANTGNKPTRRWWPKATKAEFAYIRRVERASVSERLERGELGIVHPRDYPEPLKRFLAREHAMLHIKVSQRLRKKLEALSARQGLSPDELALRWIEERSKREAV